MGSRRVGWARIKSLINENQNELKFRNLQVKSIATATTLTAGDSGALLVWTTSTDNDRHITLPAAKAGLHFRVIFAAGLGAGHYIDSVGTDYFYGKVVVVYSADNKIQNQVQAKTGTNNRIECHCNDTSTGGNTGDIIDIRCNEDGWWVVNAELATQQGTTATVDTIGTQ